MEKEAKESRKGRKAGGGGESDHGWIERERRKKMKDMFSTLQALLPRLPAKTDRCTVVDEAVRYIKSLEHTLQTAQNQRLHKLQEVGGVTREEFLADHLNKDDRPSNQLAVRNTLNFQQASCFKTWFSPNVAMNMCGDEAHISVCSPPRPGLLSTVFYILEKHNLDVVSAHISSDQHRCMYMIHAHYAGGGACDNLPGELSVEDTFKLAAGTVFNPYFGLPVIWSFGIDFMFGMSVKNMVVWKPWYVEVATLLLVGAAKD